MYEQSLPASDRTEPAVATESKPVDQRPAVVVRLANGKYFRDFRRRGYVAVRSLKRARLFAIGESEALERTIVRLRRKGITADVVEVKVIVGRRPAEPFGTP
jgi:hypothetical protein